MWASGSPAARCGVPELRQPVSVGPSGQQSSRYPGTIAPAAPGRGKKKRKRKYTHKKKSLRISAAAHPAAIRCPSAEFPIPIQPPLFLTGLGCASGVAPGLRAALARKQTARGGRKTTTVAAREVVLDSLPSEHLCGCSPAPLYPPSPPSCTLAGGLSLVGHMLRPLREWAGVGRGRCSGETQGDVVNVLRTENLHS